MGVIARVMMLSFMYEGSRPIVMFTFMLSLCIIMLESFICFGFHSLFSSGICRWLSSHFGIFSSWLLCIGKTNNRMMRGGGNSQAGEDVPVLCSARQAGHSPEPYQPPPSPPPHPPSTEQIMRIFEEMRSNDLLELLKSVQVMVG